MTVSIRSYLPRQHLAPSYSAQPCQAPRRAGMPALGALLALTIALAGCQRDGVQAPTPATPQRNTASQTPTADQLGVVRLEQDVWNVLLMQGSRIGYEHKQVAWIERNGQPLIRTAATAVIRIVRSGQVSEQSIEQATEETEDGHLLRLECVARQSGEPVRSTALVEGDKLTVETESAGTRRSSQLPWSPANGGYFAIERSLEQSPMEPGQRRVVTGLMTPYNQVFEAVLQAGDWETVDLAGTPTRLLRIEATETIVGAPPIRSIRFSDARGDVLLSRVETLGIESRRATRAEALAEPVEPSFDLNEAATVRIDRPEPALLSARSARYRIHLADDDPARRFASGGDQRLRSVDAHTAELTVEPFRLDRARAAVEPAGPAPAADSQAPPEEADRQPSTLLQSDDPRIVEMAARAVGDAASDADKALRLERFVRESMQQVNFTQAFATAAEVAQTLSGDCTEHAVLLAALARAAGLPARVAVGLVYIHPQGSPPGFGYHMWSEVYVDGRWIGLDATLGRGGITPGHIKVSDSNLSTPESQAGLLHVIALIGQLHIDVLALE